MEKQENKKTKKEEKKTWEPLVSPIIAEDILMMQNQCLNGVPSDVNGSYTGTPVDGGVPIQDADDL